MNSPQIDSLVNSGANDLALIQLSRINPDSLTRSEKYKFYEFRGKANLGLDKHDQAFDDFTNAKRELKEIDSIELSIEMNLLIIEVLSHQRKSRRLIEPFLNEYVGYAMESGDSTKMMKAYVKIAVKQLHADYIDQSVLNFDRAIDIAYGLKDTVNAINYKFNKGVLFNADSSGQYTEALKIFKEIEPFFIQNERMEHLAFNYNNQAKSYRGLGDYKNAIKYYLKADSIPIVNNEKKTKLIFYQNMAEAFEESGDFASAVDYLKLYTNLNDSIATLNQDRAIAEADNKFRASEKEKELILEEQISSRNKNIAYSLAGTLVLGSIIAFLVYRNTKRKQRIAEQEREIEVQKTEKLLKEQELNTIDAMIAGQEKERQRLASDLHDSVGATLSAAKLQFEHLKKNRGSLKNEEEIFDKTQTLLEDAYTEVRSMAHAKNSGVIAKNGLLPAVKKLAKNASANGKLQVEVQDYGLDQRLDGSLEIAVFRIIQELVTNIIKHADASEASVSLTQHEDSINVVVEDNGCGFKAGNLSKGEGMGLGSIEKRIEHMEGQMEVDTTPGKGSSIIIDIPL